MGCSCAAALCPAAPGASGALDAGVATNPLVRADAKTAASKSLEYTMTVRVAQAGHESAFAASGAEFLRLHEATMTLDTGKLDPAVGNEKMMLIGSRAYVDLGFMDSPRARRAHIKPWIVLNLKAAAGYDPWSLARVRLPTTA